MKNKFFEKNILCKVTKCLIKLIIECMSVNIKELIFIFSKIQHNGFKLEEKHIAGFVCVGVCVCVCVCVCVIFCVCWTFFVCASVCACDHMLLNKKLALSMLEVL